MRTARKSRSRRLKPDSQMVSHMSTSVAVLEEPDRLDGLSISKGNGHRKAAFGIDRVPTHVVTVPNERRAFPRASLRLPLRIMRIAGAREARLDRLMTVDISSSGLRTHCPVAIAPGTPVNLEVELVERPMGLGSVRLLTLAHVVRSHADARPGWHTLAFSFDEISFERDELLPPQFALG
jgi:hypothetical protein